MNKMRHIYSTSFRFMKLVCKCSVINRLTVKKEICPNFHTYLFIQTIFVANNCSFHGNDENNDDVIENVTK